jgi:hypothetical protein
MDAGEPPEQPAAVVVPAENRRPPPSYFSTQTGVGAGVGKYGLAGSYFVFGDIWPLEFVGVGLEWTRAGSTGVDLFDASANNLHNAIRGRVSFRWLTGSRGTLSASASIGRGTFADFPIRRCASEVESGCFDDPSGYTSGKSTRGAKLSFGGEVGAHGRFGPTGRIAFGVVLRADVVAPAAALTLGPTLGFEI